MPATVYKVARWSEVFEIAASRRYKSLSWVSLPVDVDSNGYQELCDEFDEEAAAVFGAWCALVKVAARCPVRGVLAGSSGRPLSARGIAKRSLMPVEPFKKLIEWAAREDIGWLEEATLEDLEQSPRSSEAGDAQSASSRQAVEDCAEPERPEPAESDLRQESESQGPIGPLVLTRAVAAQSASSPEAVEDCAATALPNRTEPNVRPNLTERNQTERTTEPNRSGRSEGGRSLVVDDGWWREALPKAREIREKCSPNRTKLIERDRADAVLWACLSVGDPRFACALDAALGEVHQLNRQNKPPNRPFAYVKGTLQRKLRRDYEIEYHALVESIEVPDEILRPSEEPISA